MFNQAVVRGLSIEFGVDLGLVAETLLFYDKVHLAFDGGTLSAFLNKVGMPTALDLLSRGNVSASFTPQHPVVESDNKSPLSRHRFGTIVLAAHPDGKRLSKQDLLVEAIARGGNVNASSRTVEMIRRKIKIDELPQGENSAPAMARRALSDKEFASQIPKLILPELCPEFLFSKDYVFEPFRDGEWFSVLTDLPFDQINQLYHSRVPATHSTISTPYMLAHVVGARSDAYFAASRLSELVSNGAHCSVIRHWIFDLIKKRDASVVQQDVFQEVAIQNGRTVREVINSGERTFDEFLLLLDNAERFRTWLHAMDDDAELVQEYVSEINAATWTSTLPAKALRFSLFTGLGALAHPAVGAALGAFDAFLIDRLVAGWRPNQFVERDLRRFVRAKR